MWFKRLVALTLVLAVVAAETDDWFSLDDALGTAVKFLDSCGSKELSVCLKERALKFLDTATGNVELAEGVTLKESETNNEAGEPEPQLPEEPRARESALDNLLANRAAHFLSTHTLEFKLPKSTVDDMKRSFDEARKKKKKMLLPLLLLMKLKAAMLLPLALGAIALLSFKALVVGKIALVISTLIALKKLIETKHSSSYEVIAHPHTSHSDVIHEHHGHFARSLTDDGPQNLAYKAHVKQE